ncbi:MAG: hypothetical protein OEZ01_16190, partial [Candidatus Heimdallarchaeota archaeon]|nr:hypothetical protein [Candidatus Heimdallarchaeota archaeon]
MSSQQSETIILIGDPDYDILNVLRQHYESLDYLVFTTRSMYEINQFFGHLTIDVIIIDTSLHG